MGMEEEFPDIEPFPLRYEIGMGVACSTLILSTNKGKYTGHLQCYSMRKAPTTQSNIYDAGECVSWRTILAKDWRQYVATNCPTRGT